MTKIQILKYGFFKLDSTNLTHKDLGKERTNEEVMNPEKELRQQIMVLASWHHHLCVSMIYIVIIQSTYKFSVITHKRCKCCKFSVISVLRYKWYKFSVGVIKFLCSSVHM